MRDRGIEFIRAAAVCDAAATWPGQLLLDGGRVLALGAGASEHEAARHARRVDRPGCVLIPGMVNAHTHLDLTHIGPRPCAGFMEFVETVRRERRCEPAEIAASVRAGVAVCRAAGVVAVGDIAGAVNGRASVAAAEALRECGMRGVSFVEFFAIGKGEERGLEGVREVMEGARWEPPRYPGTELGIQPHATNTVSLRGYREAAGMGVPLATHLAETADEAEFVGQGAGPQREFLERLGLWDERQLEEVGKGLTPVGHLAGVLGEGRFLAAHVNYATDADIGVLVRTGTRAAYCPRASAYFGAERVFGQHRYREMRAAGVTVALGTDSIINLPGGELSVLEEMRFLWRRDGTPARELLEMGTVAGARALGMEESSFRFEVGREVAGVVAVEGRTVEEVMGGSGQPELIS